MARASCLHLAAFWLLMTPGLAAGAEPFEDRCPVPSPDGAWVLFQSNRPAAGRTAETARTAGLFLVATAGGPPIAVDLGGVTDAVWSPDGISLAYCAAGELVTLNLTSGERRRWKATPAGGRPQPYLRVAWLTDGRLAFCRQSLVGTQALLVVDPARPDDVVTVVERPGPMDGWASLCADSKGRLFAAATGQGRPREAPYRLERYDRLEAGAAPTVVAEPFAHGRRLLALPDGRLLGMSAATENHLAAIDPDTGRAAPFAIPTVLYPDAAEPKPTWADGTVTAATLPDGTLLFSHDYWTQRRDDPRAVVLWACSPTGADVRLVTSPDPTPALMWQPPAN